MLSCCAEFAASTVPSRKDVRHWCYSRCNRKSREVHSYCRHGLRSQHALRS